MMAFLCAPFGRCVPGVSYPEMLIQFRSILVVAIRKYSWIPRVFVYHTANNLWSDVSRRLSVELYMIRLTNLIHFSSILPGKSYLVDGLVSNLKVIVGVLWAIGNSLVFSVRESKKCKDLSKVGLAPNRARNGTHSILRDPTASKCKSLMRRRSFHSSRRVCKDSNQETKENSLDNSKNTKVFKKKKDSNPVEPKANRKESLVILVNQELQKYKTKQGKYNGLVKLLSKPEFLVACYESIRGKPGNMTPGTEKATLDGLSWDWFVKLADSIKRGQHNFSPIRVLVQERKDKIRPLGVGSPRDKIVQKALAVILEQIWEPEFLNSSHGFRPRRSVHTALGELYIKGGNYSWVIQGDITGCFDSIPHDIIMRCVSERIACARTLELITKAIEIRIQDGDSNRISKNLIGTPQGSVLSPILANIVLHKFDCYMKNYKLKYDKGTVRRLNLRYSRLNGRRRYSKDPQTRINLRLMMRKHHCLDMMDPNFRRLLYVRYADDFVICIIGSISEAKCIRRDIRNFLKDNCGLELNMRKTVITNIAKEGFNFLGAHISRANMLKNHMIKVKGKGTRRATTRLRVNLDLHKILKRLVTARIAKWIDPRQLKARGTALNSMVNHSHADIICFFNSKINGLCAFYSFAGNRSLLHYVIWILRWSCGLTLAKKYKVRTLNKIYKKYGRNYTCPETGIELQIPESLAAIHEYKHTPYKPKDLSFLNISWAAKLTESNIKKTCVLCGTSSNIEMHHVRSIKNIRAKVRKGNASFAVWSGAYKRKQIPLCSYHHSLYHRGLLNHADINIIANFTKVNKEDSGDKN